MIELPAVMAKAIAPLAVFPAAAGWLNIYHATSTNIVILAHLGIISFPYNLFFVTFFVAFTVTFRTLANALLVGRLFITVSIC